MAYIWWRRGKGVLACRVERDRIPLGDRAADLSESGTGAVRPDGVVVDPDGPHRKVGHVAGRAFGTAPSKEKGVFVEMGSRALFFVNGRYEGELTQGAYRLDRIERMLEKQLHVYHPVVVLMDAGETTMEFKFRGKRSRDLQDVDLFLQVALQLTDPEMFYANVMKGEEQYLEIDLRDRLYESLASAVEQFVASRDGKELSAVTDHLRDLLLSVAQGSCRDRLASMGFDLLRIDVLKTSVEVDEIRKRNAARRMRETAETDDAYLQLEVDADKAELLLRATRQRYDERKTQLALDRGIELEEGEEALVTDVARADLEHRREVHDLDVLKDRIDLWARFADETLRKEILKKNHVEELRLQLEEVKRQYDRMRVIGEEEWRKFNQDIDWARLEESWEREERQADHDAKVAERGREREHILTILDMKLARELEQETLRNAGEIHRLKLKLAREQIQEQLGLDKVEQRAKQELSQILFEGRRQEVAQDQQEAETRFDYDTRIAGMKQALNAKVLRHEVEVHQIQTEIALAAVDRQEAVNLLAQVVRRGNKQAQDDRLSMEARETQSQIDRRRAEASFDLEQQGAEDRANRESRLAARKAEMDAGLYAAEARHRAGLLKLESERLQVQASLDAFERRGVIEDEAKKREVSRLAQVVAIGEERKKSKRAHEISMTALRQEHQLDLKRLANELRIAEIEGEKEIELGRQDVEKHIATEEGSMGADQIEARRGLENARIADYQARGSQREVTREREIAERERRDARERDERTREDARRREDAMREDMRVRDARDERIIGAVAAEVRMAGQGASVREREEREREVATTRAHADDLQRVHGKALDTVAGVKRESVTEQHRVEHHTHVNQSAPLCPRCQGEIDLAQGACAECGRKLD